MVTFAKGASNCGYSAKKPVSRRMRSILRPVRFGTFVPRWVNPAAIHDSDHLLPQASITTGRAFASEVVSSSSAAEKESQPSSRKTQRRPITTRRSLSTRSLGKAPAVHFQPRRSPVAVKRNVFGLSGCRPQQNQVFFACRAIGLSNNQFCCPQPATASIVPQVPPRLRRRKRRGSDP